MPINITVNPDSSSQAAAAAAAAAETLQNIQELVSSTEGTIIYTTLADALALAPKPADGIVFQVSTATLNAPAGYYSFQSTQPNGIKYERAFLKAEDFAAIDDYNKTKTKVTGVTAEAFTLLSIPSTNVGYITAAGAENATAGWKRTSGTTTAQMYAITVGLSYYYTGIIDTSAGGAAAGVAFYNAAGVFISAAFTLPGTYTNAAIVLPATASYMAVCGFGNDARLRSSVSSLAIADKFITGEKISFVSSTGYNKYNDATSTANFALHITGDLLANTNCKASAFISVKATTQYTINGGHNRNLCFYDQYETFISYATITLANGRYVFTTPANCAKIRVTVNNADTNVYVVEGNYNGVYFPYKQEAIKIPNLVLQDSAVAATKTTFLAEGKNFFNIDTATASTILSSATGATANGSSYVDYSTSDYIAVTAGLSYAISTRFRRFLAFNANKVSIQSTYVDAVTSNYIFTATENGYIRISIYTAEINSIQVELGNAVTSYEKLCYKMDRPLAMASKSIAYAAIADDVRAMLLQDGSVTAKRTNFLANGKNMFSVAAASANTIIASSTGPTLTDAAYAAYVTSDYIAVTAGVPYAISTRFRKFLAFNSAKTSIMATFVDANTSNYIFTPTENGYIRISVYTAEINSIQVEQSAAVTAYEAYCLKPQILLKLTNKSVDYNILGDDVRAMLAAGGSANNPLAGKKVLNFGDSIMAGDGNAGTGPAELIATNNGMTVFDYAVGGATIAVVSGSTNNILSRVNDAIAASITTDYIIFDGLTNDISGNSTVTLGTVSSGYLASLDTSTFSGSFETICKKIKTTWPAAKVVYVRVHKMLSRDWQKQIDFGNRAAEICQKWSIPVVDLYNEGGLNAYLTEHINAYTNNADQTHPNALGYVTFYVPMITSKMKSL